MLQRVWAALSKFGAPLENLSKQDLLIPETVTKLGVTPRRIDIMTQITGVDYDEAEPRKVFVDLEGIRVPIIGLSHLLQKKSAVCRPRDKADVARLEQIQSKQTQEE